MDSWLKCLKRGSFRKLPEDRLGSQHGYSAFKTNLKSYDTQIEEKGVNLSEGQKQRLPDARALIKDPDILLLDEPTFALDRITEESIFQVLPALVQDRSLPIVAHRPSTIRDADRILLLNENRLVAMETHQSLRGKNDYYRSTVCYQQAEGNFRISMEPGNGGLHG
jgi:ABC-type multidrug transport system fused ATPase/permease subunit